MTGCVAAACSGPEPQPPSDPELRAELEIADDVRIHRIDLSGRGSETRVLPPEVEVRAGDVVQFVVLDYRVHLVRFVEEELRPAAMEFLTRTGQDRPPPLVERGARLVLSFEDAPAGWYPFRVEGSGAAVRGEIRVLPPE
ncbi:MAG: hypothetical protein WD013_01130 [Gemmatimonadota bacterium]